MSVNALSTSKRKFNELLKAARIGEPEAQYEVALMYANGIGVSQSVDEAVGWLKKSAQRDYLPAQYLLATRYEAGVGVTQDVYLAQLWYSKAAEKNHAKAAYRLGRLIAAESVNLSKRWFAQSSELGSNDGHVAHALARVDGASAMDAIDIPLLERAAARNNTRALRTLGDLYSEGVAVAIDLERAVGYYRKAARLHDPAALMALYRIDLSGLARTVKPNRDGSKTVSKERRQEFARWTDGAAAGDEVSKYWLGVMFRDGVEVPADIQQAVYWLRAAALGGSHPAQLALAELLESSDVTQALSLYEKATQGGLAQASFSLGRLYLASTDANRNVFLGIANYAQAASRGYAAAQMTLGLLLEQDTSAFVWECFSAAANSGEPEAQYQVGQCYSQGKHVGQDLAKAVHWTRLAAESGHVLAQTGMGASYFEGMQVKKDFKKALYWLAKPAESGDARAQWLLARIYLLGAPGLDKDLKLALHWSQRAAEQGFAPAQATLGLLYAQTEKYPLAAQWLQPAAAQGDAEAQYNLAILIIGGKIPDIANLDPIGLLHEAAAQGVAAAIAKLGLAYVTGNRLPLDPVEAHKWFLIGAGLGDAACRSNLERSVRLLTEFQRMEAGRRVETWKKGSKK